MKKKYILIILLCVFCSISGIYAGTTLLAKDILFTTSKNSSIKTVQDALNDLYQNGTNKNSDNINDLTINTSLNQMTISITSDGTTTKDESKIIGYFYEVNGSIIDFTKTFPVSYETKPSTTYNIAVYALNSDFEIKKSNIKEIVVPDAVVAPLEYPLFTNNGVANVSNTCNGKVWYSFNKDYDCTAADALPKEAYDGDESTYVDVSQKYYYFILEKGNSMWNYCYKSENRIQLYNNYSGHTGSNFTVVTSDTTQLANGYWHATYWGKTGLITNNEKPRVERTTGKIYEMYFDKTI